MTSTTTKTAAGEVAVILSARSDVRGGTTMFFGEMADGVDDHQRALPAVGLELPPDPAAFEMPVRQLLLEPFLNLGVAIRTLFRCHSFRLLKK